MPLGQKVLVLSVADPGNRKGGFQSIEREVRGVKLRAKRAKFGVTPTSGAVKLGKIHSQPGEVPS